MPRSHSVGALSWISLLMLVAVLGAPIWLGRPSPAVVGRAESKGFVLEITADHRSYAPGDPLDVTASLTYMGPASTVHIIHGAPLLGFGVREPLLGERLSPGYEAIRQGTTLARGVPAVFAFRKSASSLKAFDPAFEAYLRDPVFWLPEGVWTIYVTAMFQVASGETANLDAAMTIQVAMPTN